MHTSDPGFLRRLLAPFLAAHFRTFLGIGVINALNGVVFSYLFSLVVDANLAFVLGYLLALTVSYPLNARFVFPSPLSGRAYLRFVISYIPNFAIQNLCVLVVYNVLQYDRLIAYIVAVVIGVPVTFILLKVFAFRGHDDVLDPLDPLPPQDRPEAR